MLVLEFVFCSPPLLAQAPAPRAFNPQDLIPINRVADMQAYASVKRRQSDGQLIAGSVQSLSWASTLPGSLTLKGWSG